MLPFRARLADKPRNPCQPEIGLDVFVVVAKHWKHTEPQTVPWRCSTRGLTGHLDYPAFSPRTRITQGPALPYLEKPPNPRDAREPCYSIGKGTTVSTTSTWAGKKTSGASGARVRPGPANALIHKSDRSTKLGASLALWSCQIPTHRAGPLHHRPPNQPTADGAPQCPTVNG